MKVFKILRRVSSLIFGMPSMCATTAIVGLVICSAILVFGFQDYRFVSIYLGLNLFLLVLLFGVPPGKEKFNWALISFVHGIGHLCFYLAIYNAGLSPGALAVVILLSLGNSGNIIDLREALWASRSPLTECPASD